MAMSLKVQINLLFIVVIAVILSLTNIEPKEDTFTPYELELIDIIPLEVVMDVAHEDNCDKDIADMLTLEQWMTIEDKSAEKTTYALKNNL